MIATDLQYLQFLFFDNLLAGYGELMWENDSPL